MMRVPAVVIVGMLAACGGAGSGSTERASAPLEPTVRDSAGVTIYEHAADALERAPLIIIDSVPLAVFAGDVNDPSQDLAPLTWPTFLGSGDLVAVDRSEYQVVILRPPTGERNRFGRRGSGPGEIGFPGPLYVLAGDSLLFNDSSNDRVTFLHPDTGIVRTFSRSSQQGLGRATVLGRLGDSLYLVSVPTQPTGPPAEGRVNLLRHLGFWRFGEDSVVGQFSVPTGSAIWVRVGRGMVQYGLGFAPRTTVARWGDGYLVARGERWSLEQWGTSGLAARVTIERPLEPVTDSLFERFVRFDVAGMLDNMRRAGLDPDADSAAATVRERGHVEHVAAYGRVHVSPNGTVWVLDYPLPGDSSWAVTAVGADGRILGRIEARRGNPPIAWGDDRVAFKSEDALGIATITVHRVRFPE